MASSHVDDICTGTQYHEPCTIAYSSHGYSDHSSSRESSKQQSGSENEPILDETTETESGDKDGDSGVIFPYRFQPYTQMKKMKMTKNVTDFPQDIDRLQNVEW